MLRSVGEIVRGNDAVNENVIGIRIGFAPLALAGTSNVIVHVFVFGCMQFKYHDDDDGM